MLVKQPRLVLVNYHLVQHVYCHGDLQGRGPEHVEVGKHVGDLLSVHRHKVDNLARSRTFLGLGCDREGLAIDGRYKGRLDPKANQVHPVEVGGEEEGLHEGHEEKADRVEHTAPHWGVGRARKVDDCFQEDGGDEDGDVVDELQTAAREKAEAKADDKWTEDRKVFFGEVAFTWLDLHLSTIARREAGLWNLPGGEIGSLHHWLPVPVEDGRHSGTLVPGVELPEVGGGEGALEAGGGQGVEPGEGDDRGEGGRGFRGWRSRALCCWSGGK